MPTISESIVDPTTYAAGVVAAKVLKIGSFQYQRHFEHKIAHLDAKESVLTVLYCLTTRNIPYTRYRRVQLTLPAMLWA